MYFRRRKLRTPPLLRLDDGATDRSGGTTIFVYRSSAAPGWTSTTHRHTPLRPAVDEALGSTVRGDRHHGQCLDESRALMLRARRVETRVMSAYVTWLHGCVGLRHVDTFWERTARNLRKQRVAFASSPCLASALLVVPAQAASRLAFAFAFRSLGSCRGLPCCMCPHSRRDLSPFLSRARLCGVPALAKKRPPRSELGIISCLQQPPGDYRIALGFAGRCERGSRGHSSR